MVSKVIPLTLFLDSGIARGWLWWICRRADWSPCTAALRTAASIYMNNCTGTNNNASI